MDTELIAKLGEKQEQILERVANYLQFKLYENRHPQR